MLTAKINEIVVKPAPEFTASSTIASICDNKDEAARIIERNTIATLESEDGEQS